jgi:hypothetical protein
MTNCSKLPWASRAPWAVKSVEFDAEAKRLTVLIDFAPGTHFGVPGHDGLHPVHDTVLKDYRHLNFFQQVGRCHVGALLTPSA